MPRSKDLDNIAPDDPIKGDRPSSNSPPTIKSSPPIQSTPEAQKATEILGHTKSPFSSLLIKPHVFNFEERNDSEEIILVARQHWFTNVFWILVTFVLVLIPLTLFSSYPLLSFLPANYQFITIIFWYLASFVYAFEKFLTWYFNVYIVTNERIVDIDFNNLLIKKYSEAQLDMIQDVSSSVIGAIPTMFNYGDVLIQTASEVNQFVFGRVPNPEKIIKLLQELREVKTQLKKENQT